MNDFSDSDHLLAYHIHKRAAKLSEDEFALIALSRKNKRSRGSWSLKVTNFNEVVSGGRKHGNAEKVYKEFKTKYESSEAEALAAINSEVLPFSDRATDIFSRLGFDRNALKPPIESPPMYHGVVSKKDIERAAKELGKRPGPQTAQIDVQIDGRKYDAYELVCVAYKIAGGGEKKSTELTAEERHGATELLRRLKFMNNDIPDKKEHEQRLICALAAKPFVILAGGTGTGKTKSAIETVIKLCKRPARDLNSDQYAVIPVGADWTDTRPLLGYENVLRNPSTYTVPPALRIILAANRNAQEHDDSKGTSELLPYFLILDEMNLSHVERYFSDFLSLMEAKKIDDSAAIIELHGNREGMRSTDDPNFTVPSSVPWPRNLFVIGTVNIDETAHTFSPKVLDRAHVIEYKPAKHAVLNGIDQMIQSAKIPKEESQKARLENQGKLTQVGQTLVMTTPDKLIAAENNETLNSSKDRVDRMFECLKSTKFAFSHRTAQEAVTYVLISKWILNKHQAVLAPAPNDETLIDYAILQKILPKINGSTESLSVASPDGKGSKSLLHELLQACVPLDTKGKDAAAYTYAKSAEKLKQMHDTLNREHFVSFIQ